MSIYHFIDLQKVETFFRKEGATEYRGIYFETEDWGTCCTLVLSGEENLIIILVSNKKENLLKGLWQYTSIPSLLNQFDLPSSSSESSKSYTLRMLLMYLEAEGSSEQRAGEGGGEQGCIQAYDPKIVSWNLTVATSPHSFFLITITLITI